MMDLTNRQLAAFLSSLVVCAILVGIGVAHVELMGSPFALLVQMGGRRNQGDSMRPPPIAAAAAPLPAPHGPSSLSAKMMMVACALALLVACRDVSAPPAPLVEAGAGLAHDVCSLVEGIDDDGAIRSICATVDEIAQIVAFVTMLRASDAGAPRASETCGMLPETTFCATSRERARAILFVVRARAARFAIAPTSP